MPKLTFALVGLAMSLLPTAGQAADKFTFEDYFNGRTEAVGSFSAINGVKRSFTVDLTGKWDGKTLTLREDFVFDDGTKDRKTWRFTKTGPTTYSGTREDVIGETYIYLISRFASDAGKKAGEFYTPQPISTILSSMRRLAMQMGWEWGGEVIFFCSEPLIFQRKAILPSSISG